MATESRARAGEISFKQAGIALALIGAFLLGIDYLTHGSWRVGAGVPLGEAGWLFVGAGVPLAIFGAVKRS